MAQAEPTETQAAPLPAPDLAVDVQETISLDDLARGVLDRSLRPRAADIRRLAEGVLARAAGTPKKAKKDKSAASPAKTGKKGGGKKRKLAKIPGSKG